MRFTGAILLALTTFVVAYVVQNHLCENSQCLTHTWLYSNTPPWFRDIDGAVGHGISSTYFTLGRFGIPLVVALTPFTFSSFVRGRLRRRAPTPRAKFPWWRRAPRTARRMVLTVLLGVGTFLLADFGARPFYPEPLFRLPLVRWFDHVEPKWVRSRAWLENDLKDGLGVVPIYLLPLTAALFACQLTAPRRRHPACDGEPCCARCGYILTGLPTHRCPECGMVSKPERDGRLAESGKPSDYV